MPVLNPNVNPWTVEMDWWPRGMPEHEHFRTADRIAKELIARAEAEDVDGFSEWFEDPPIRVTIIRTSTLATAP